MPPRARSKAEHAPAGLEPTGKERVFSGMRPTGRLHLGNYLGALQKWVELQDEYDCIFSVADLHALTTAFDHPADLHGDGLEMVADWIGAGVDPERSVIFRQSAVPEHSELALLLGMVTPTSWLERVPTYKGQITELGDQIDTFGFFGYPVLQTADIVLYRARRVPVGQDQLPHLELAREIVRRFNHLFGNGKPIFPEPEPILTEAPLLLGTDNRKMSKSYGNTIEPAADPDEIRAKVNRMITDPQKIRRDDPGRPEVCTVFQWERFFGVSAVRIDEIARTCRTGELGCVAHKTELAERLIEYLGPFRERRRAAAADPGELERILARGAEKARDMAVPVLDDARRAIGL